MPWNWEQEDWPNFGYDENLLRNFEDRFLRGSGMLIGALEHLDTDERDTIAVRLISEEALKTSEIEGEYLDRESIQSSIRKQLGLQARDQTVSPAEQGIAEMMVDVYKTFDAPLTNRVLFRWHRMLLKGRKDLGEIGQYRTGPGRMQIVSGAIHNPKIHFEAPPSDLVDSEMNHFLKWFEHSKDRLPILTRAGIAHAYFVTIHPFNDGNGRIGRALSEKAMAEALGAPTLVALAQTIESKKKLYYEALQSINRSNEITSWLLYFADLVLEAQKATILQVEFAIAKAKFYDRFGDALNSRQSKMIGRVFQEGPHGFKGGLSAENYIAIAKTSRATATRDLTDLTRKGALTKEGELKHTRYSLNLSEPKGE